MRGTVAKRLRVYARQDVIVEAERMGEKEKRRLKGRALVSFLQAAWYRRYKDLKRAWSYMSAPEKKWVAKEQKKALRKAAA